MKTPQRILISTITLMFFMIPTSIFGQWSYVNSVDEFTDEKVNFVAYSDDEHQIQISYQGDAVWMFITKIGIESFEPNGLIELRVDKNETLTIDPEKLKELGKILGKQTFQWEPKTVGFLIWHGKEDEDCGFIGQLIEGEFLSFRYQISSLDRETYKISLVGAKEAIIDGLNLTICGR
jgi:hypothetical protein